MKHKILTAGSIIAVLCFLAWGAARASKQTPVEAAAQQQTQQTAAGTEFHPPPPGTTSPLPPLPILEKNSANTPPEVINAVNGILIESQEIKSANGTPFALWLTLKNVSQKPIACISFARQREPVTSLINIEIGNADFSGRILLQPGAETKYQFALTQVEPPLVARISAVVYGDGTSEGDAPVRQRQAERYVQYNAEAAALLAEMREASGRAKANGIPDNEAARNFATDLKQRAARAMEDTSSPAARKQLYAEYSDIVATFASNGEGLSGLVRKMDELQRSRPTRLPSHPTTSASPKE